MIWRIGLTDDPSKRKRELENPSDWQQTEFNSEDAANEWKTKYLQQSGYVEDTDGSGWLFGYWYSTNLIQCPDCKKLISPSAASCPGCGRPMGSSTSENVLSVPVKKKKETSGCAKFALFAILAVVVLALIGSLTGNRSSSPSRSSSTAHQSTTTPTTTNPSDNLTMGERNALAKAEDYLAVTAFSREGLIEQLEYEGFSHSDAVYGADHCGTNWNQQAALKAQDYLNISSFSRQGLIEQLEYEGYTNSQAVYGVEAVGY